jgi:hypothetical protein
VYHFQWYTLDGQDEDALGAPPPKGAVLLKPQTSPVLGDTNCAEPFREAQIKHDYTSEYNYGPLAQVALDGNGNAVDAWLWGPATFHSTEVQLVRTARWAEYTGARAYCKPVPSIIFYGIPWPKNTYDD